MLSTLLFFELLVVAAVAGLVVDILELVLETLGPIAAAPRCVAEAASPGGGVGPEGNLEEGDGKIEQACGIDPAGNEADEFAGKEGEKDIGKLDGTAIDEEDLEVLLPQVVRPSAGLSPGRNGAAGGAGHLLPFPPPFVSWGGTHPGCSGHATARCPPWHHSHWWARPSGQTLLQPLLLRFHR